MSVIEVRNITKRFGTTLAVDHISFDVAGGDVLGFLGPNGAGKSTTMRILTGYIPPNEGNARVAGHDLLEDSLALRRCIGYLPENAPLYGDMEVIDFLRFVGEIRGIAPGESRERIGRMVRVCGLEKVVGRVIHHLSKGYRQRVGLAQAMIHDPDILILDEPTSGLDPNQIIEIRELIRELGHEKTVILSTHILSEVAQTCNRVLIINEGALVESGTPDELARRAEGGRLVRVVVRAASKEDVETSLAAAPFVESCVYEGEAEEGLHRFEVRGGDRSDLGEQIYRLAVEKGWSLAELRPRKATLEDAFRRVTRGDQR